MPAGELLTSVPAVQSIESSVHSLERLDILLGSRAYDVKWLLSPAPFRLFSLCGSISRLMSN